MDNRLEAFEAMLAAILRDYQQTAQKMTDLKGQGKEKTVTFRQLMAKKLELANMLAIYRAYGLVEEERTEN